MDGTFLKDNSSQNLGTAITLDNPNLSTTDKIKALISSSDVFLFMKGTPDFPRCGFSANTVDILNRTNVSFNSFDILTDMELRESVKEFSNWPTYPQLFFKGELLGGNDIITQMHSEGELEKTLKKA